MSIARSGRSCLWYLVDNQVLQKPRSLKMLRQADAGLSRTVHKDFSLLIKQLR
jgi:hypothetical protein